MKHLGELIDQKINGEQGKKTKLAKACDVTPQAVNGWIRTGKIASKHYPTISKELNIPIQVLHGLDPDENTSKSLSEAFSGHLSYEDSDIEDLVKWWPNLPENIKNSIRLLLQDYLESLAPELTEYLNKASRSGQKKANNHFKGIPKKKHSFKQK